MREFLKCGSGGGRNRRCGLTTLRFFDTQAFEHLVVDSGRDHIREDPVRIVFVSLLSLRLGDVQYKNRSSGRRPHIADSHSSFFDPEYAGERARQRSLWVKRVGRYQFVDTFIDNPQRFDFWVRGVSSLQVWFSFPKNARISGFGRGSQLDFVTGSQDVGLSFGRDLNTTFYYYFDFRSRRMSAMLLLRSSFISCRPWIRSFNSSLSFKSSTVSIIASNRS